MSCPPCPAQSSVRRCLLQLGVVLAGACSAAEPPARRASADAAAPDAQTASEDAATNQEPRDSGTRADAAEPPASDGGSPAPAERLLNIVAHPDDDLGMMNPDLLRAITRGAAVQTVFLTAGNSGFSCVDYPSTREEGLMAAYAEMAKLPDHWTESRPELLGHQLRRLTLDGSAISLTLVGLNNDPARELRGLWQGELESITTWEGDPRRPLEHYTREELVALLLSLLDEFAPTHVNINDASVIYPQAWPFDHPEHVHAGLFSLLALERYAAHPVLRMYRAYNIQFEPENLFGDDATGAWQAFETYAAYDPKICSELATTICGTLTDCANPAVYYEPMKARQYPIAMVHGTGLLTSPSDTCISRMDSTVLATTSCAEAPSWRVELDDSVRDESGALCLTAADEENAPLVLAPCAGGESQRFRLTERGQLRGPGARCAELVDGQLVLLGCGDRAAQLGFALRSE